MWRTNHGEVHQQAVVVVAGHLHKSPSLYAAAGARADYLYNRRIGAGYRRQVSISACRLRSYRSGRLASALR
jgi:hypothetical protein